MRKTSASAMYSHHMHIFTPKNSSITFAKTSCIVAAATAYNSVRFSKTRLLETHHLCRAHLWMNRRLNTHTSPTLQCFQVKTVKDCESLDSCCVIYLALWTLSVCIAFLAGSAFNSPAFISKLDTARMLSATRMSAPSSEG